MATVAALYLWALSIVLLVMMGVQYRRRTHDLLSMRNFFIAGFVLFQTHSAARSLYFSEYGQLLVMYPGWDGIEFAGMCTLFIVLFLWIYEKGFIAKKIADRIPSTQATLSDGMLLGMAFVMAFLGVGLRFGVQIPLVASLASGMGTAVGASACGLVGWVWGRRLLNPALMVYAAVILAIATVSEVSGAFGRRGLVAIFAGLLWGMYYSRWRYQNFGSTVSKMLAMAAVPFVVTAMFTGARGGALSLREHWDNIRTGGSLSLGAKLLTDGQSTGAAAIWVLDNYPEKIAYRHLFSPYYFLIYDIPRSWWPGKPMPLCSDLPFLAEMRGVGTTTIPAGVVGNAGAEGGWYAVAVYALWMAVYMRILDQLIQNSVTSPFVVLALGSQLGQVLGMPRGETAAFANILLISSVALWVIMLVIGKLIEGGNVVQGETTEGSYQPAETAV